MTKKRPRPTGQDGLFAMIRIRKTTRQQLWQRKLIVPDLEGGLKTETLDDVIVRMIKGNDEAKAKMEALESELAELRKKEKKKDS